MKNVPPNAKPPRESIPLIWLPGWISNLWLIAVLFGACTFACTVVLDWFLLRMQRWTAMTSHIFSNGIFAVIVTVLLFRLMIYGHQRRKRVDQRLATIDEMNHHIRNALQVISFNARAGSRNEFELAEIGDAVNRIQWALREIVPKLEPEFTPFEGPARLHVGESSRGDELRQDEAARENPPQERIPPDLHAELKMASHAAVVPGSGSATEQSLDHHWTELQEIFAPLYQVFLVIGGSILLAIAARFTLPLPFTPVPLTLQNFAVLLLALILGSWRGLATATLYLGLGAAGLPVFGAGTGGLAELFGPTGGYLLAYPVVAFLAGRIFERTDRKFMHALLASIVAELVLFTAGVVYLMTVLHVPFAEATSFGLYPFVFAEIIKVMTAAAIATRLRRVEARD